MGIKTIINIQGAVWQIFECLATQLIYFILQNFFVFKKLHTLWCLHIHWKSWLVVLALGATFLFRVFFIYFFFLYFIFLRSYFLHWRLYFALWMLFIFLFKKYFFWALFVDGFFVLQWKALLIIRLVYVSFFV